MVPKISGGLMTMTKSLYWGISLFLITLSILFGLGGVILLSFDSIYMVEWNLGGGVMEFTCTFLFDYMSCLSTIVVFLISSNVVWYRQSYLSSDKDADRFILLVFGFVVSMFLLIVRPNIVRILLGWDGLGLISYCLVIYYPTKKSNSAGILTVLRNRVGDVCILLAIAWFRVLGDFNFFNWVFIYNDLMDVTLLRFLIVVGAMTKRAQIPFSAWLPAAMAAPTPVSALVHSSTLVTAGVYLLIRFSYLLDPRRKNILLFLSVVTMFMSGLVAVYEYDLKKIIALSTLSQLGVMMFSISLGLYLVAFLHLVIHALFKAMLFLCAGVMIHGVGGSQDIRVYGSQIKNFPLVSVCLNLANMSLCGIPFLSGFYSKDIVVELAAQGRWNLMIVILMFLSLGLTVAYSVRLVYYRLVGSPKGEVTSVICDKDYVMVIPILNLTLSALVSGPLMVWLMFPFPELILLPVLLKMGALFIITFAVFFTVLLVEVNLVLGKIGVSKMFRGSIWFLPSLRGQGLRRIFIGLGSCVLKNFDQGWIEQIGVGVISSNASLRGGVLSFLQNNRLKTHFMVFLVWFLVLFVIFLCFRSLILKRSTEDANMEYVLEDSY